MLTNWTAHLSQASNTRFQSEYAPEKFLTFVPWDFTRNLSGSIEIAHSKRLSAQEAYEPLFPPRAVRSSYAFSVIVSAPKPVETGKLRMFAAATKIIGRPVK